MIYQQRRDDCGVAAVATFLGMSYETVAEVWEQATGRPVGPSSFKDLRAVIKRLTKIDAVQTWHSKCSLIKIVRARPYRGSNTSHWIVVYTNGSLWCPYSGLHENEQYYEQPFYSNCLYLGDSK